MSKNEALHDTRERAIGGDQVAQAAYKWRQSGVRPWLQRGRTSPEQERLLRRCVVLQRGAYLGLDTVPGVVWCRVADHGGDVAMPPGHCHVEVWGGRAADVFACVQRHQPPGVAMTIAHRQAGPWQRVRAWLRWQWWRLFADPRRHA